MGEPRVFKSKKPVVVVWFGGQQIVVLQNAQLVPQHIPAQHLRCPQVNPHTHNKSTQRHTQPAASGAEAPELLSLVET